MKDLEKAVAWEPQEPLILSNDEFTLITGLRRNYFENLLLPSILSKIQTFLCIFLVEFCQEYNDSLIDVQQIQREINENMKKYQMMKEEDEMKTNEPDEEGWVTVLKK